MIKSLVIIICKKNNKYSADLQGDNIPNQCPVSPEVSPCSQGRMRSISEYWEAEI